MPHTRVVVHGKCAKANFLRFTAEANAKLRDERVRDKLMVKITEQLFVWTSHGGEPILRVSTMEQG